MSRASDWVRGLFVLALGACAATSASPAASQDTVCAEVRIEIKQKLNIERQGFIATMRINNGLEGQSLSNVAVNVKFTDASGAPVVASTDPNASAAKFFIREDQLSGITGGVGGAGVVAPRSTAEIRWLIIPAAGTGGTLPGGVRYGVGATLTYRVGLDDRLVEVVPEVITVQPQPELSLDYFLTRDVYSDDPQTATVEPAEPFTLGVRIRNAGAGLSRGTRIESAQPRIVENTQGLAIGFRIVGSFLQDQPTTPSLLIDFGDIEPGKSKVGRWQMNTTLSGRFVDFGASYTHADELGGALTSLVREVTPHLLVRDVLVTLPGRDAIRDFLALDGDTLRVYESESLDTVVADQSAGTTVASGAAGITVRVPTFTGFGYARVVDPTNGALTFDSVRRPDGRSLAAENAWKSRTRNESGTGWNYFLNVFDANGGGDYLFRTAAPPQPATLAGAVYDDANNNGIRDAGEPGIGGVAIQLEPAAGNSAAAQSATTVADGAFAFSAVAAGRYTLRVGAAPNRVDGTHRAGTAGGTIGPDAISGIDVPAASAVTGYLFAKRLPDAPASADLVASLASDAPTVAPGQSTVVRVGLQNLGPSATSAQAVLGIPPGVTVQLATASAGTFDPATAVWTTGALAAQQSPTLALTLRVDEPGPKTITLAATGSVADPNGANDSASLTINAAAVITAAQEFDATTRLAVFVNCRTSAGGVDRTCTTLRESAIRDYLAAIGIPAFVTSDPVTFREFLRSGRAAALWISGGGDLLPGKLVEEAREFAAAGKVLVIDGARDTRSAFFDNLAGASFVTAGSGAPTSIVASAAGWPTSPLSVVGATSSLALAGGTAVATFVADSSPAIVSRPFAGGRVMVAGFEWLRSAAEAGAANAPWAAAVRAAVEPPSVAAPASWTPNALIPQRLTLRNLSNAAQTVEVRLELPEGAALATTNLPPMAAGVSPSWRVALPADETRVLTYGVRVATAVAGSRIEARVARVDGAASIPVTALTTPITVAILDPQFDALVSALAGLSGLDTAQQSSRDAAVGLVQSARTRFIGSRFDSAIADLTLAGDRLQSIAAAEANGSRRALAELVGGVATAWHARAPRCGSAEVNPIAADNAGFYAFAPLERLEVRGGRAGAADWEWGLGTNTQQAGSFAQINSINWVSGRTFNWELSYTASGAATLRVNDGASASATISFPQSSAGLAGMRAGDALQLYAKANADVGTAVISASITEINGRAANAGVVTLANNAFNEATQTLYFPSMRSGFNARGTTRITFPGSAPPTGSRLNVLVTAGAMACRPELGP